MNSTTECYTGGDKGEGGIPMPCVLLESMSRGNAVGEVKTYGFSMGSKTAVWVAKDTSTRTVDPETEVVTENAGPGGEYVWVDDPGTVIEGWVQPQKTDPASLQSHVDDVCSLLVEFTGQGFMTNNGPGESIEDGVYGFGFTVSGSVVDGAIGKIERISFKTGSPMTDIVNPNGNWTIQQWMSTSFKLTGDKNPDRLIWGGEATRPDGPNEKYRRVENNAFVYSDFPGLKKKSENAGNLTYGEAEYDFDIKLIDGSRQCEVRFHVSIAFQNGKLTVHWGARP